MNRIKIISILVVAICFLGLSISNITTAAPPAIITIAKKTAGYVPVGCTTPDNCPGIKCAATSHSRCNGGQGCTAIGALTNKDIPMSSSLASGYASAFAATWVSEGIIDPDQSSYLQSVIVAFLTSGHP